MSELIKYEAARHALAIAASFDEVLTIKNAAEHAELYARQAKDTELIAKATEIRVRAQRRAGEMLTQAAENGQRGKGRPKKESRAAILSDIGLTSDESSRYQKLAAIPAEQFEDHVATARSIAGEITTDFILARSKPAPRAPQLVDNDEVAPAPPAKVATHKEQSLKFYNAVRDLGELTCSAAELHVALPSFQHFRILENVGPALALLQKVSTTWKT